MSSTNSKNGDDHAPAKWLGAGLMDSMTSFLALCSKHTRKLARNSSPRKLVSTISHKAIQFRQKKRIGEEFDGGAKKKDGEGVWQRTILMGDKCQPLDFSGVIYYDSDGNRLTESPMRTPRASPLPSFAYKSEKSSERSRLGW